jgi:hypothetical protein
MFRYCSSVAFLALLAFSCSSKNNDDDDSSAAGGGFAVGTGGAYSLGTGGAANIGGDPNAGGASINSERNMRVPTQEDIDLINAASCTGWTAEGEMIPANIEFIVDTSGSMTDETDHTGGKSKWEITRTALENSLDTLPRLTSVGMLLWPDKFTIPNNYTELYQETGDVDACVNISAMVPMGKMGAVGSDQRLMLASSLDAVTPQGGTPTADAYMYAISKNFAANPLMAGSKYAVLITDGQPTIQYGCRGTGAEAHPVDVQPVLDAISSALQNNQVKTFVIGSPGSEKNSLTNADVRDWLSQAAQNGGTKAADNCQNTGVPSFCHFDMSQATDFAAGFASALQNITGQILDCKYKINDTALAGQKVSPEKVNVIYQINGSQQLADQRLVGRANDPSCPEDNGWYLDPEDPSGKTVRLCPLTCQKIQQDAGAIIEIRGGCDAIIIIN